MTRADGSYELVGLVPGETYEIALVANTRLEHATIKTFTPERAETIELGDTPARPR
jgi:hypothetical protein